MIVGDLIKNDVSSQLDAESIDKIRGADLDAVLRELRSYVLASNKLPLSPHRQPFAEVSDENIQRSIERALVQPTRRGRLTNAVRDHLSIDSDTPAEPYSVLEAHIDLTTASLELRNELIKVGFEPDNFAEIQPIQYQVHFTIQHIVPKSSSQKTQLFDEIRESAHNAANLIDQTADVDGYVEVECYTSSRIFRYADSSSAEELDVTSFPFTPSTFVRSLVPRQREEYGAPGFDSKEKRAADIHVKLFPHATYAGGYSDLEDLFQGAGFYRIRSDAGNYMYSAHFSELDDSNRAYDEIVKFSQECRGIASVMREICTSIWRKRRLLANGSIVSAEVPPHLRFR